jgi:hypothetical protein
VSDARGVPTEWSDTKNLAWKTELPGPGSSSPIFVGDRVFVTCYTGDGTSRSAPGDLSPLQRHLICVALSDGKVLWDRPIFAKQPEDRFNGFLRDHGYATRRSQGRVNQICSDAARLSPIVILPQIASACDGLVQ